MANITRPIVEPIVFALARDANARDDLAGPSGPTISLSNASFPAGSAEGTAIGALSVVGGTGTYAFTLTDSASNKVKVAGANGVNLQAGSSSSSAGSFSITVHADNGAGSVLDRVFMITATAAADLQDFTATFINQGQF